MKILVVNGPNMNMLGIREPEIYGTGTYDDLCSYIRQECPDCEIFQSNHEGDIIDKIQQGRGIFDALVINPAGYSHTSVAIADAIKAAGMPAVEVHLSDIFNRESYRRVSITGEACEKIFCGNGFESYKEAIDYLYAKS